MLTYRILEKYNIFNINEQKQLEAQVKTGNPFAAPSKSHADESFSMRMSVDDAAKVIFQEDIEAARSASRSKSQTSRSGRLSLDDRLALLGANRDRSSSMQQETTRKSISTRSMSTRMNSGTEDEKELLNPLISSVGSQ